MNERTAGHIVVGMLTIINAVLWFLVGFLYHRLITR
jgi:hypothetical protein